MPGLQEWDVLLRGGVLRAPPAGGLRATSSRQLLAHPAQQRNGFEPFEGSATSAASSSPNGLRSPLIGRSRLVGFTTSAAAVTENDNSRILSVNLFLISWKDDDCSASSLLQSHRCGCDGHRCSRRLRKAC
jgi:hypothetical protein